MARVFSTSRRSVRGRHSPVPTLMIEGTLMKSTPGGNSKNAPPGHPTSMSAVDPDISWTKRVAIAVFLLRCPNPNPSWEYIRSDRDRLVMGRTFLKFVGVDLSNC